MGSQKNEATNTNSIENKVTPSYGKIVLSLENCLLPLEKLEKSPSVIDGLDPETEYDLRIIGCELIQTAGILLKIPQVAMATGQVLFQRFYFCKSFVRHPMDVSAMGCVYLASKIEEAPRRIRDVINVFHHIRQVRCQKPITPLILDQQYIALKTQVIKAERRILKELGFCVHVKHPHKIFKMFLLMRCKLLPVEENLLRTGQHFIWFTIFDIFFFGPMYGDQSERDRVFKKLIVCYLQVLTLEKNRAVMQMAWNYMNDSLRTEVFLQYSPETVACACIYLTARKLRITLPKNPPWFAIFNVKEEDILDVCRRTVRLYKRPKIDPDALELKVELLRKSYEEEREKIRSINVVVSGNNTPTSNTSTTNHKTSSPPRPPPKSTNHVKRSRSRLRSESPKKKPKKYRSKRVRDDRDSYDSEEESGARSRSASYNYWKKIYSYA